MRVAILAAAALLTSCSAMQPPQPRHAGDVRGTAVAQEAERPVPDLVAAFDDGKALRNRYPQAELIASYGEVTIWRVALTAQQREGLPALGRYSPVFGAGQGQWRALPGGVIVRLALKGKQAEDWFRARNLSFRPLAALPGTYVVDTPPGLAALETSRRLRALSEVVHAEPDWWQAYSLRK